MEVLGQRFLTNPVLGPLYSRYVEEMGLRGDERVLDYGSGSGAAARHLAKRLEAGGGRLTCMDVSARWQAAIRKVLRGYSNVEYRCGDVREMGLPEASFDVVLVHWMLHDVPPQDRPSIVAELARLLRPGGRLFSREPTGARHGMPAAQARELFAAAGLTETLATESKTAPARRVLPRGLEQAGGLTPAAARPGRDPARDAPARCGRPAPYARKPARFAGFSTSTSRGLARDPPDSGSGISTTNERGWTFRGLPLKSRQTTGCCCVTQWMLPSAFVNSRVGTGTTGRPGKRRARMSRASSSAGSPNAGMMTAPFAM